MVLKLTAYIKNSISFPFKPKTRWNSDIKNYFSEIFIFISIFDLYFIEYRLFQSSAMVKTSL